MAPSPLAGQDRARELLIDLGAIEAAYVSRKPDAADPGHRVDFATSSHCGSPFHTSFTEADNRTRKRSSLSAVA